MAAQSIVRPPAVAGKFYPADPEVLRRDVESYLPEQPEKVSSLGCMVPHAGYMYSGRVAGAVLGRLRLPQRFVILCPNHTGRGEPLAIMSRGAWATPLGEAQIDRALAAELVAEFDLLTEDAEAHRTEHALEVELPFLQVLEPGFTFVPIAIGTRRLDVLSALGKIIARVIARQNDKVLVIASSDMNHYATDAVTREKDALAIAPLLARDPRVLHETVIRENISMCGLGPAVAMIAAVNELGANSAELVKYATSADVSGDRSYCVGYAGIIVR
jgi:AmmeMemoRadiSam system protein B